MEFLKGSPVSRWKLYRGEMHVQDIQRRYLCHHLEFVDESINEWKFRQMEDVLHSKDFSMEVSESFW